MPITVSRAPIKEGNVKQNKLRLDLLPISALEETARAFMDGLTKYPAWDWLNTEEWQDTYFAALQRHLFDWRKGVTKDEKSGLHPLAHVAANSLILLTRTLRGDK